MKPLLAVTLLAAALPALAAPPPPAEPPPEGFSETIDVRVIDVQAVVTGHGGERVRGLQAGDFRLLVDGKEVPVDFFTEVADGAATPAAPGAEGQAAEVPAPVQGVVGRSVLVFVDQGSAIGNQLAIVVRRMAGELDRLAAEDRVAVVACDGRKLAVLTGWTADRAAVRAALEKALATPAGGLEGRVEREDLSNDEELLGMAAEAAETPELADLVTGGEVQSVLKMRRTMNAAMAALRNFAGAPGRKAALLLSGGWPLPYLRRLYPQLIDTANRLGYTLYPVDVAGLETSPVPVDASKSGWVTFGESGAQDNGLISSERELEVHDGLELLARGTGGKASVNSNRLQALDRLVADTASYYWLGFSPTWKGDGRRHDIRVEVRRPGFSVRARRGFSDLSVATEQALAIEGRLLLGSGTEKRLGVELGAPRFASLKTVIVPVVLHIPAGVITFVRREAGYHADLPLHISSYDNTGQPVELPPLVLRLDVPRLPPAGETVHFRSQIKIRRGERRLRFVLQDTVHDELLWGEAAVTKEAKEKKGASGEAALRRNKIPAAFVLLDATLYYGDL
jgi:VWFA-related protein